VPEKPPKPQKYVVTYHAQRNYLRRIDCSMFPGFDFKPTEDWTDARVISHLTVLFGPKKMRELRMCVLPPEIERRLDGAGRYNVYNNHIIECGDDCVKTVKPCWILNDKRCKPLKPE
jgi:hypothetical protein